MATRTDPPAASPASTRALALLQELPGFLKKPAILTPIGLRSRAGWAALGVMEAFHIAVLFLVVLPLIGLWQQGMRLPTPDAFDKLPSGWLLPFTVLIAPLAEEMVFRGWQTGRPRALWLLACSALFAILVVGTKAIPPLVLAGSLLALAVAALVGWIVLRKRQTPARYRAAYPSVFWIVALLFAGVHLTNYPSVSLWSLPLVLPQLWAALMLGFTRQRIGLPAAMLQHMGANAATMVLVHFGG